MNQASPKSTSFIPEYGPHVPEDKDQCLVVTPYGGVGLVIRTTQRRYDDNNNNTITNSKNQTTKEGISHKDEVVTMKEIELINWANTGSHGNYDQSQDDTTTNEDGVTTTNKDTISNNGRPIRPTMLYTPIDYPSVVPVVGSDVLCQFGRGRVIEIRRRQRTSSCCDSTLTSTTKDSSSSTVDNENNDIIGIVVQLSSWRLANRSKVTCYLQMNTSNTSNSSSSSSSNTNIRVVRHKKVYEMSIVEKIEYANEIKQFAAIEFTQRHYTKALQYYIRAVDAVKYVQHSNTTDSTNAVRADLLLVMITCCNNCATCSIQVQQYDIAIQYAQQALSLIETLEQKKNSDGKSKIYYELVHTLHCYDIQLFGIYKIKSLLIMIRVHVQKDNIDIAIDIIKKARHIIATYITTSSTTTTTESNNESITKSIQDQHQQSIKQLKNNDKEIMKLYTICKERKKVLYQKEKLRAQAMFTTTITSKDDDNTTNNKSIQQQIEQSSSTTTTTAMKHVLSNIDDDPNNSNNIHNNNETKLNQYDHQHKKMKSNGNDNHNNDNDESHTNHTTDTKTSTTGNNNNNDNIPWHTDPYFLGGLGVIIGTIGTLLVLSQIIVYPSSKNVKRTNNNKFKQVTWLY